MESLKVSHRHRRSSAATSSLFHFVVVLVLAEFSLSCAQQASRANGNVTDQLALLEFKASLIDPRRALSSWNSSSNFCQWFGVSCGRRNGRVTALDLQSLDLSGTISPHVGNLSFLRFLILQNNSFHSRVPLEVGNLSRLQYLYLNNNSLTGLIPPSLTRCTNLVNLSLSYNILEGQAPVNLSALLKLRMISLRNNNLTGVIPPSVGNSSSLLSFDWSYNKLGGTIPDTIGKLRNLKFLAIEGNDLVGNLPLSVTNISSLETLALSGNQLEGTLPSDLGIALPNLRYLSLFDNHFSGSIPESISNMTQLTYFILTTNSFTGDVPSFKKMDRLYWFSVGFNQLGSRQANDIDFLCSLTNSSYLRVLLAGNNNFGGSVPECTGNLSITLQTLVLQANALSGYLPSGIGNLINLQILSLTQNNITGVIPLEIGHLKKLSTLYLANCEFTGEIPHTIGNLSVLNRLSLRQNNLVGPIPSSLGNFHSLQSLDLSLNKLTGAIPTEIMSLSSLSIYAGFAGNNLSGVLPMAIGNLKNLVQLDLYSNKFSGEIPSSLRGCTSLEYLYMMDNMFTGPIPSALSSLTGLQELNFSHNRLSGRIPNFLESLHLTSLDLSFNNFEGSMPMEGVFSNTTATSVVGNQKLCGGLPEYQLPKCKPAGRSNNLRARNASIYAVSGFLSVVFALLLLYFLRHRKHGKIVAPNTSEVGFPDAFDVLMKVSYRDLLEATDRFSDANLIGTGSFGSVFKGFVPMSQTPIAVKVLNLDRHGASKSFIAECEALRNIRHRNLVKVLTAYSGFDSRGNDFKALVYEYMPNGSLEEWLYPPTEICRDRGDSPRQLGLIERVNIALDVACALDYLHHQCESNIVHRDLKPSNILLDDEMTAHVGDFGLVRFMPEATRELISGQKSCIGVNGTVGYIAPEYGVGLKVSTHGDVYSYGILILEMFTGKRPTSDIFVDGLDLHSFAKEAFPERVLQIIDPVLLQESRRIDDNIVHNVHDCLVSIVELGVVCSFKVPGNRMNMREVVSTLQSIRNMLIGGAEEIKGDTAFQE